MCRFCPQFPLWRTTHQATSGSKWDLGNLVTAGKSVPRYDCVLGRTAEVWWTNIFAILTETVKTLKSISWASSPHSLVTRKFQVSY